MLEYRNINVNPKGRKTGDCSTRAIVSALGISYEEAIMEQAQVSIKHCYGLADTQTMNWLLKKHGYIKMKQPRKYDGKKYKVKELDQVLTEKEMQEGVVVSVANHFTYVKDGAIQDTWNCGNKSVSNYWVKED